MKQRNLLLLPIVLVFVLSSCNHQTDCECFSTDDMTYFPYRSGDTIRFVNQTGNEFNWVVSEVKTSQAYNYKCRDLNGICGCERFAEAHVSNVNDTAGFVLVKLLIQSTNDSYRYYYNVLGCNFELDFELDAPYVYMMPDMDLIGNFAVSDSLFTGVYRVTNQNFTKTNVQQVYFSKESGVIRFDEYIGGNIWQLKLENK